jgi:hypothetical protein
VVRKSNIVILLNILLLIAGCGGTGANSFDSSAPELSYYLLSEDTGGTSNQLIFVIDDESEYQFKINGENFSADVEFEELLPLRPLTALTYTAEGEYSLELDIVQHDGTPYLSETLDWTYSTVIPDAPIVSFSETATSDAAVLLQVSSSRGADTKEIWIEGDLLTNSEGVWRGIGESGLVSMVVSDGDGVKSFSVKVRNIYGNESEYTDISILRTSDRPTGCNAEIKTNVSSYLDFEVKLSATATTDLFYAVYGDVKQILDFQRFTSGAIVEVESSAGAGVKNFTIQIKNAAGIYCKDDFLKEITFENGHQVAGVTIDDDPAWTTSTTHAVSITYDYFPSAGPMEMMITGDVTGDNINKWLPYSTTADVELSSTAGKKIIFMKFMGIDGEKTYLVSDQVWLNPSVSTTDEGGGSHTVYINNILDLDTVTITGCTETYTAVDYAASYACTDDGGGQVTVKYDFDDGTTTSIIEAL